MKLKTSDQNEIFSTLPVSRAVLVMALPAIFSQIIVLIYNMADTFYLGQTNNAYMVGGVSLILPVFNITLALAGLCGIGGSALISRLLGTSQKEEARKACVFSFYLSLAIALVFSLGLFVFARPLLGLLGASANTYDYAWQYLFLVLVLGGIPTILSNTCANLVRSVGFSAKASFGITMGGVLNIFLDPLFMFWILPADMEVIGVGVATLISNSLACLYFIYVLIRFSKTTILSLSPKAGLPKASSILSIFTVGVPSSVATLLFDLDYAIIGRLMSSYNDFALAAIGVVLKVERLPLNVGIGICQGMLPIVAFNYGAKNFDRMKKTISFSLASGIGFALVSLVVYELAAPFLIEIFIRHQQTLVYGSDFLRIRSLATPLMFISFFILHCFQGFNKGGIALMLGVVRWAIFNIPMLYLLNLLMGMMGIVWAQTFGDILTVIFSLGVYYFYQKKHFAKSAPLQAEQ